MVVCQDETEEITDEHDLDNDADDLDDDDVAEDASEHLVDDLDIQTKEKEIIEVTFWFGKLMCSVVQLQHVLESFFLILWLIV